jgi:hypothetical protein
MTSQPANFRKKNHENEETCEATKLWLERRYNNHTTTKRTKKQKDVKTIQFSE